MQTAGGERQNDNRQTPGENIHLTYERRRQGFDAGDHGADDAQVRFAAPVATTNPAPWPLATSVPE